MVAPLATPSSLVLSAADIEPAAEVVAAVMPIAGAVPPVDVMGAVPVTSVTVPVVVISVPSGKTTLPDAVAATGDVAPAAS